MKYDIIGGNAFPLVRFYLDAGETIKAEPGAMVAMTRDLKLVGKMDGGIGKAIARMFSGESFFMQSITAEKGAGWVLLAASVPGEIMPVEVKEGDSLIVQKNGFFAGTPGIEVSTKAQSISKGLFSAIRHCNEAIIRSENPKSENRQEAYKDEKHFIFLIL